MILDTVSARRELLERARTVAMIGASANPLRPSYTVFSYLRTQTAYDVAPINPTISEIDGVRAYPSLTAYAQAHGAPDIVDVFRKPSELVPVVREAIAVGAKAIWFQYGVINQEAIALADQAGMSVVVDRCIKVEWARLHGGLSTSGLNSGLITSRRPSA
ncbi:MAG TPA: CoA-binding protein [Candidatus Baltobacteraceae bacterium]|nr:CoA-binding protein [Candidatus Baltobacteraceae bacterium]